ncbi:MAG: hypothetical protein EOO52_13465 [Gammaproteobacteria bacterium]|nr:MAG: hypothetical protein EOO52_13465 [Gammaproteobacteria bacterium]
MNSKNKQTMIRNLFKASWGFAMLALSASAQPGPPADAFASVTDDMFDLVFDFIFYFSFWVVGPAIAFLLFRNLLYGTSGDDIRTNSPARAVETADVQQVESVTIASEKSSVDTPPQPKRKIVID